MSSSSSSSSFFFPFAPWKGSDSSCESSVSEEKKETVANTANFSDPEEEEESASLGFVHISTSTQEKKSDGIDQDENDQDENDNARNHSVEDGEEVEEEAKEEEEEEEESFHTDASGGEGLTLSLAASELTISTMDSIFSKDVAEEKVEDDEDEQESRQEHESINEEGHEESLQQQQEGSNSTIATQLGKIVTIGVTVFFFLALGGSIALGSKDNDSRKRKASKKKKNKDEKENNAPLHHTVGGKRHLRKHGDHSAKKVENRTQSTNTFPQEKVNEAVFLCDF